jgi:hypothetical protein
MTFFQKRKDDNTTMPGGFPPLTMEEKTTTKTMKFAGALNTRKFKKKNGEGKR